MDRNSKESGRPSVWALRKMASAIYLEKDTAQKEKEEKSRKKKTATYLGL